MNQLYRYLLIGIVFVLVACETAQPLTTPLPLPPTPTINAPSPEGTAQAFLNAWLENNYSGMYSLLSPLSQDSLTEADFESRYAKVMRSGTVIGLETKIYSVLKSGASAKVLYEVTLHTAFFGDIVRKTEMPLVYVNNHWAVSWTESLILPELAEGGTLSMELSVPARGNIYDREGKGLAVQGEAVAVGVQPGLITDEAAVLDALSKLLNRRPEALKARYADANPDWYIPLGEVAAADVQANFESLTQLSGVVLSRYTTRFYPNGGVAAHVIGYLSSITPDKLADYRARGYTGDERVGITGLESWGEEFLRGQPGGTLSVVTPNGKVIPLAQSQAQPAHAIYTTFDRSLQTAAEQALGSFRGSVIVMNAETGAILALASNPSFDPNLFDPTNRNSSDLTAILSDPTNPLLNRATQGIYPPGSVFKVVVGSAGLLSGLYKPETQVNCGWTWNGLGPGFIKYDWTYAAKIKQRGKINLVQALQYSCNPYFYTIALDLHNYQPDYLSLVARQFGFGQFTNIEQINEARGLVPDPTWKQQTLNDKWVPGDTVNMGVGQGYLQVTPLQIAVMMAALRNGGTRYRPQVVERIVPIDGSAPVYQFQPESIGQLPINSDQLAVIKQGLHAVTSEAGGTARQTFSNFEIPVSGKTGTAEDPAGGLPHAWFAGYTEANQSDKPDIAIVVMLENRGEGSYYAAPIFRRIVEIYFTGKASRLYPWESDFGVSVDPTNATLEATPTLPPVFTTPEP